MGYIRYFNAVGSVDWSFDIHEGSSMLAQGRLLHLPYLPFSLFTVFFDASIQRRNFRDDKLISGETYDTLYFSAGRAIIPSLFLVQCKPADWWEWLSWCRRFPAWFKSRSFGCVDSFS